jgi:acyl-homoserine-lactone acylase
MFMATAAGNIFFLHNGRIAGARKRAGIGQKYLPGDRSDLIWQQPNRFDAMPQITNPASGYLLSTNQTPFNVTAAADNLRPADYPKRARPSNTHDQSRRSRADVCFADAGRME